MDAATRRLFARQLGHWAQAAVLDGRYPFRKVETESRILTREGEETPPLVLWINRESCMAGGLLYFPGPDPGADLDSGARCAQALGLRHFVTWGLRDVVFWECAESSVQVRRSLPVPEEASTSPTVQHDLLLRVLDELKLLSVLGSVPPEHLAADYLANLCYGTLEAALPALEEGIRLARGENRQNRSGQPTRRLARHKAVLVLTRLLALLLHERLPLSLQPEGLERAMGFTLESLPRQLATALQPAPEEVALPPEGAIRFHHLFRRLGQLRPAVDRERAGQALDILTRALAAPLGLADLPFPQGPTYPAQLLVNADPGPTRTQPFSLCAPPAWLALQLLLADLGRRPHLLRWAASPFDLAPGPLPHLVTGTLDDRTQPGPRRRRELASLLRSSWPNRRFALPATCPHWVYECLHLLGLAPSDGVLELRLPPDWLYSDPGLVLHELLCEQFTLDHLEQDGDTLCLRARKTRDPRHPVTLVGSAGHRRLCRQELRGRHRGWLRLALALPDSLWQLLAQGHLQCVPAPADSPDLLRALHRYSRSSLGRRLWAELSGGRPLPPAAQLPAAIDRFGLPIPTQGLLQALLELPGHHCGDLPSQNELDREIGRRLGLDVGLHLLPPHPGDRSRPPASSAPGGRKQLAEAVLAAACRDGLPRFPEQYLYDHYRPELQAFQVTPPLLNKGEFFGRFTLVDGAGRSFDVEGKETLEALLLAGGSGATSFSLPRDRAILADILTRYRNDLQRLRHNLVGQAHLHLDNPGQADQLVEQIWRSLPLPPWPPVGG